MSLMMRMLFYATFFLVWSGPLEHVDFMCYGLEEKRCHLTRPAQHLLYFVLIKVTEPTDLRKSKVGTWEGMVRGNEKWENCLIIFSFLKIFKSKWQLPLTTLSAVPERWTVGHRLRFVPVCAVSACLLFPCRYVQLSEVSHTENIWTPHRSGPSCLSRVYVPFSVLEESVVIIIEIYIVLCVFKNMFQVAFWCKAQRFLFVRI